MNENEISKKGMLGKQTFPVCKYDPALLFPIPRLEKREEINYDKSIQGIDLWTCYELSWLDNTGKPVVGIITLSYQSSSKYIIESKSLKLYLNSFNFEKFETKGELFERIRIDLSNTLETPVYVREICEQVIHQESLFKSVDNIITNDFTYEYDSKILVTCPISTRQTLKSDLLRSNCLVTNQPDWGSIYISIDGEAGVTEESFLKYIVSFRNHQEFHEQCVERIIMDLKNATNSTSITVYARYTRRGGIDINPFRFIGTVDPKISQLVLEHKSKLVKEPRQ